MAMNTDSQFIYAHDPMCSWCWAHKPVWDRLAAELADRVAVVHRVGGLAPDSDRVMPAAQQQAIAGYWHQIQERLGTEFNFAFWTENEPRRSTYPACRAVIAARWQEAELAMISALQAAYYLRALNPSNVEVLHQLAEELGLDGARFAADLASNTLDQALTDELNFARSLPIAGFPSMVLLHRGRYHEIALDYQDYRGALRQVVDLLGDTDRSEVTK
ncbi:DsbA family protein [Reinekea sp.]|jgi:putative protein-disulfide isomerase|uniref:DsbA family protein n=1 Tax=Reinekea sp. TaxID=1970455 RepID=UPI002A80D14F|nr:DsbA family protein [Reinekea sp.]